MNTVIRTFALITLCSSSAWAWTIEDRKNEAFPGRVLEVRNNGQRVAEFIYGEGQFKPYLTVFDSKERRLTNPGMGPDGDQYGRFPHHRGIFIGWNRMDTDLGRDDLWHLRNGEHMKLVSIERQETTADSATIETLIHWVSSNQDTEEEGLLLTELRTIVISRMNGRTQIDHHSKLTAARDLRLGGDLQHAGLHFRADAAVDEVRDQTKYLWDPGDLPAGNGRIVSNELRWVNFRFPLHGQWYSVTQLNPPETQATELSWRDYGRFGFFFQEDLKKGASRVVEARFLIGEGSTPGNDQAIRKIARDDFKAFLEERD